MKIGFFGNVNNYPFMLARALRRMGHEVRFLVNRPERLHRPEYRYDDIAVPYPDWIMDVGTFNTAHYVLQPRRRAKIARLLNACDAVLLNELGPAFLPLLNCPGVVTLTGADLEVYSNLQTIDRVMEADYTHEPLPRRMLRRAVYQRFIPAQRAGIQAAAAVSYFRRGLSAQGDVLLDEIGVPDERRMFFLLTDVDKIQLEPLPHNQPLRLFCAARLNWKHPIPPGIVELDYKGSDVMVRGLGLFYRTTNIPLNIRLVKKGLHVAETMQLVEAESLAPLVTWLDEMSQLAVWEEFRQADIVFDQLGQAVVTIAGLDAMAMGRPLIANGRPEIFEPMFGVPSPVCQARTPEEVCQQLQRLVADPAERERVGRASRQYVETYFSADHAARLCLERLSPVAV
jgi:glycosyltransferase involved in cell wall biosynthesis